MNFFLWEAFQTTITSSKQFQLLSLFIVLLKKIFPTKNSSPNKKMLKLPLHAISEEEDDSTCEGNSFSRASSGNSDNGFMLDSMMPSETVLESSEDKEKLTENARPLFHRRNHSIPPADAVGGTGATTKRHIARNVLSRLKKINLLDEEMDSQDKYPPSRRS